MKETKSEKDASVGGSGNPQPGADSARSRDSANAKEENVDSAAPSSDDPTPRSDAAEEESEKKLATDEPSKESTKREEQVKETCKLAVPKVEDETKFTWEHFFTTHCGILREDALEYERHLIAHRLGPEDSLLESLGLITEYGRIPIGDKFKIAKALKRQDQVLKSEQKQKERARKLYGLEKYNDFEASMILNMAGGTKDYEIDYGIEQFELGMEELEKMAALRTLKG